MTPERWREIEKFYHLAQARGRDVLEQADAIPLRAGQMLPPIPAAGFQSKEAVAALPGARLISEESVFPGPNPSVYAFMKVTTQRNIYRVPVP